MKSLRNVIIWLLLAWMLPCASMAQSGASGSASLHFSLSSAIRQAQDSSIVAFMAVQDYATARYAYDEYLSSTGPQAYLNITPTYYKQRNDASYDYALPSSLNMAGISADVTYSQQVSKWGGTVYAQSKTVWSELLGDMADNYGTNRYFSESPVRVGYRQELLGWNAYKWQHWIESHHNSLAVKQFNYKMRQIAEQTVIYYFSYVSAKQYRDIYAQNYLTADTLYKIGENKFQLTAVTKDELMSLEISRTNAENQLNLANAQLENARIALLSYLHIEDKGQTVSLEDATVPDRLIIDTDIAITTALRNNPLTMKLDEDVLTAERDLDEARHHCGIQIGMDVSVGIHNINRNLLRAFEPRHYAQAEVTFTIPLYDGELNEKHVKKTETAMKAAQYAREEEQRNMAYEIRSVINLIRVQQQNMQNAQHNVKLADEAFALVSQRYADGLTDMNTYQLMLSRKDEAHQIYISLQNNFWTNYYKLTRLTMYDFIAGKEL